MDSLKQTAAESVYTGSTHLSTRLVRTAAAQLMATVAEIPAGNVNQKVGHGSTWRVETVLDFNLEVCRQGPVRLLMDLSSATTHACRRESAAWIPAAFAWAPQAPIVVNHASIAAVNIDLGTSPRAYRRLQGASPIALSTFILVMRRLARYLPGVHTLLCLARGWTNVASAAAKTNHSSMRSAKIVLAFRMGTP
jgi:hypothetical protein